MNISVGQKLYYVDIRGNVYTYVITDVKEQGVVVAWEEDPSITTVFSHREVKKLIEKCATLEDAKREAERRRAV